VSHRVVAIVLLASVFRFGFAQDAGESKIIADFLKSDRAAIRKQGEDRLKEVLAKKTLENDRVALYQSLLSSPFRELRDALSTLLTNETLNFSSSVRRLSSIVANSDVVLRTIAVADAFRTVFGARSHELKTFRQKQLSLLEGARKGNKSEEWVEWGKNLEGLHRTISREADLKFVSAQNAFEYLNEYPPFPPSLCRRLRSSPPIFYALVEDADSHFFYVVSEDGSERNFHVIPMASENGTDDQLPIKVALESWLSPLVNLVFEARTGKPLAANSSLSLRFSLHVQIYQYYLNFHGRNDSPSSEYLEDVISKRIAEVMPVEERDFVAGDFFTRLRGIPEDLEFSIWPKEAEKEPGFTPRVKVLFIGRS
jgi:hypothetical protein